MFYGMTPILRALIGSAALGLMLTGCAATAGDEGQRANPATADRGTETAPAPDGKLGSAEKDEDSSETGRNNGRPDKKPAPAQQTPDLPDEQPDANVSAATLKAWRGILDSVPTRLAKAEAAGESGICVALDDAWFTVTGLNDDRAPDLLGLGAMPKGEKHPVCLLEDTLVVVDLDSDTTLRGERLFAQIPSAN